MNGNGPIPTASHRLNSRIVDSHQGLHDMLLGTRALLYFLRLQAAQRSTWQSRGRTRNSCTSRLSYPVYALVVALVYVVRLSRIARFAPLTSDRSNTPIAREQELKNDLTNFKHQM
jgi:hypothetical protein